MIIPTDLDLNWLFEVFMIVLLTSFLYLLQKKIFNKNFKTDQIALDDGAKVLLIKAVHKPILGSIWLIGLYVALLAIKPDSTNNIFWMILDEIKGVGLIILFMWFAYKAINGYEIHFVNKSKTNKTMLDVTSIHALVQLLKISVLVTAIISLMKVFNMDITALITVGGIGGVGIAFAAKELLANFFGGLLIILDRPFEVGDWIRSPDKDIEGTVEHIGWRLTRIRTFDKRPRYIPNSVFLTLVVDNASRMSHRRIKTQFGLRYEDSKRIDKILHETEEMLRNHPEIDSTQTLMVKLIAFGESSLDIMIYTFTKTTNWVKFQSVQQDVFLKILEIVSKNGAECAFPTREIMVTKS